ncbi:hypothetical protein QUF80_16645 [Desulfococcaceae bacterium HSG8]|nr:hypothetical protein [Desulfococcaceae bacterium HSG8]
MKPEPKEIRCECGNTLTIERDSDWCLKCGSQIFYDQKARRAHKINNYYMYTVIILVMFFLAYVFVELIAIPAMNL